MYKNITNYHNINKITNDTDYDNIERTLFLN